MAASKRARKPTPQPAEEAIEETPTLPSGAVPVRTAEAPSPSDALLREFVVLVSNASYGPVVIDGKKVTAYKNKLYHVPNAKERADILGTGRFRIATVCDQEQAGLPSAGKGGAVTVNALPPGAVKGGLIKP